MRITKLLPIVISLLAWYYPHGAAAGNRLANQLFRLQGKDWLASCDRNDPCHRGGGRFIPCLTIRFQMSDYIITQRLQLSPLDLNQLELALQNIESLETSLNIMIMRPWMTDRVRSAIGLKIDKMWKADISQHDWLTYWLIVIREENVGAGILGFKGFPDENGSTEIGYGIDESYQGQGYMREAVQALIDWAFTHPFCKVVTASEVENPASRRILEKLGAQLLRESEHSTSWEIRKAQN